MTMSRAFYQIFSLMKLAHVGKWLPGRNSFEYCFDYAKSAISNFRYPDALVLNSKYIFFALKMSK